MTITPSQLLAARVFVAVAAGALLGGCARHWGSSMIAPPEDDGPPARTDPPVLSASGPPREVRAAPIVSVTPSPLRAGDPTPEEPVALPGPPATASAAPAPAGPVVFVEAKVGDINGKPIYAGAFFDETGIGDKLLQESRKRGMTPAAWRSIALDLIRNELRRLVRSELFEAEARASLEPAQQTGLRAIARMRGEAERRRRGGSQAALERSLAADRGQNYEQYLRDRERDALIQYQYERMVRSRVFITMRDLERYYERHFKEFNPDPRARFRVIRVPSADEAGLRQVREALERGEPFERVASLPVNTANPQKGGLDERAFTGEYRDQQFFGSLAEVNEAVRALEPGAWTTTPVPWGSFTAWIKLEAIVRESRPLSDESVQLEILDRLSAREEDARFESYIARLADRAGLTDMPEIMSRLLWIAERRFWQPGRTE